MRPVHFLLAEDDDSHATITLRSLRASRIDSDIHRVTDGAQALDYLLHRGAFADVPRPDVILLDLKLPKVDGHDVLAAIKQNPELCDIPVVVLTTSDTETDRARAYAHHANSYLVKPTAYDAFRQMLSEVAVYWGFWNEPPLDTNGGRDRHRTPPGDLCPPQPGTAPSPDSTP